MIFRVITTPTQTLNHTASKTVDVNKDEFVGRCRIYQLRNFLLCALVIVITAGCERQILEINNTNYSAVYPERDLPSGSPRIIRVSQDGSVRWLFSCVWGMYEYPTDIEISYQLSSDEMELLRDIQRSIRDVNSSREVIVGQGVPSGMRIVAKYAQGPSVYYFDHPRKGSPSYRLFAWAKSQAASLPFGLFDKGVLSGFYGFQVSAGYESVLPRKDGDDSLGCENLDGHESDRIQGEPDGPHP